MITIALLLLIEQVQKNLKSNPLPPPDIVSDRFDRQP
ncbi:hypothetical protein GGE07_006052 [Sinorhizobium terangae]|nr:hypothetical protein [Sinorhizobium terangae]